MLTRRILLFAFIMTTPVCVFGQLGGPGVSAEETHGECTSISMSAVQSGSYFEISATGNFYAHVDEQSPDDFDFRYQFAMYDPLLAPLSWLNESPPGSTDWLLLPQSTNFVLEAGQTTTWQVPSYSECEGSGEYFCKGNVKWQDVFGNLGWTPSPQTQEVLNVE